jgi:hypothetical protein
MVQAIRLGFDEAKFWAMSPRKLVALIEADRQIEDARLSRLAYVIQTGQMPGAEEAGDEDEEDDGRAALYF